MLFLGGGFAFQVDAIAPLFCGLTGETWSIIIAFEKDINYRTLFYSLEPGKFSMHSCAQEAHLPKILIVERVKVF